MQQRIKDKIDNWSQNYESELMASTQWTEMEMKYESL